MQLPAVSSWKPNNNQCADDDDDDNDDDEVGTFL